MRLNPIDLIIVQSGRMPLVLRLAVINHSYLCVCVLEAIRSHDTEITSGVTEPWREQAVLLTAPVLVS